MRYRGHWSEQFLRKGWPLLCAVSLFLWQDSTWAQSLQELQHQSQELERAIAICGNDPDCLMKAAQKAGKVMQGLQSSPEINRMVDTPCLGFDQTSYPSSDGGAECLPLNIRIFHKATLVTSGCTSEDERFTYAYVYESLGQIIRDTNRNAYILNTLMPAPGGRWRLDLRHVEYFMLKIAENCRPAGSVSFGPKDIDFGKTPSVALIYDHGYTNFGSETAVFSPLGGLGFAPGCRSTLGDRYPVSGRRRLHIPRGNHQSRTPVQPDRCRFTFCWTDPDPNPALA